MHIGLLLIGSLLPFASAAVYAVSILHGTTRPHRTTRLLMVVIGAASCAVLLAGHQSAALWLAASSLLEGLVMWFLSFKHGVGGTARLDIACLVFCAVGVGLWLASGQSLLGLGFCIAADLIACVPSFVKTVRQPHTECWWSYALCTLAGGCIALASARSFAALLFPVYIGLINAAFVAAIWWPRRKASPNLV